MAGDIQAMAGDLSDLRQALWVMTERMPSDEHQAALDRLNQHHPHSIRIVASDIHIRRYTCLVHALGFTGLPGYLAIAGLPGNHEGFAGTRFGTWLLDGNRLGPQLGQPVVGDLVFYFRAGRWQHVGLQIKDDLVQSKWGNQHLMAHGLWEVPSSYGDEIQRYRRPSDSASFSLFRDYAAELGMIVRRART